MLDSIKVLFNGLVSIWTGASVDIQAEHQVALQVCPNLREIWSVIHEGNVLIMLQLLQYIWGQTKISDKQLKN